jgi:hypothetical protein
MLGTSENHFGPSLNYMVDDLHERYAQMVFTSWMAFIIVVVVAAAMEAQMNHAVDIPSLRCC